MQLYVGVLPTSPQGYWCRLHPLLKDMKDLEQQGVFVEALKTRLKGKVYWQSGSSVLMAFKKAQHNSITARPPWASQQTWCRKKIVSSVSSEKTDMKIKQLTSLVQSLVGKRHFLHWMQMDEEEEDDVLPLTSIENLDRL